MTTLTAPKVEDDLTKPTMLSEDVVVKTVDLVKTFKDFWYRPRVRAVDNVNIEITRGQVFGLLGPNGSGKSTTIKLLLGLLKPTSGRIAVLGHKPEDVKNKDRIGYLPEESYLYRFLNAQETLDYYGRLFHQSQARRKDRIDKLLHMVGLTHAARRPVGEYSKGMQRKIGLAQALINDPELLILDEPTTGMDPIGTKQVKDLIRTLADRGKTILLCSHLLADVEDVCDRVAIMFGGKVRAEGTVDELLTTDEGVDVTLPPLDEETRVKVIELLESRGVAVEGVRKPRQRLEDLFLDIVHSAQSEGQETSGSRGGGAIASFLSEEDESRSAHMPEDMQAAKVIDDLMRDEQPRPRKVEPVTQQTPASEPEPSAPAVDNSVLDQLTRPEPVPAPKATEVEETKPESPDADMDVIDSLLGDDDKQ